MQNLYDIAHELVRSLKETDQYKDYKDMAAKIKANEQVNAMMEDFQQKSMEYQTKMMAGEAPSDEDTAKLQQLSAIIMSDPLAAQFLGAQMQLQTIIADIYRIIGEAAEIE